MRDYILYGLFFVLGCMCMLIAMNRFSLTGNVVAVPSDSVDIEGIKVYDDRVIIPLANATLGEYTDTGSMGALLGSRATGIRIKPSGMDEINIGDIVSVNFTTRIVVHRVIEKGVDEEGAYVITKGDAATVSDGKVRMNMIEYKLIAIVY